MRRSCIDFVSALTITMQSWAVRDGGTRSVGFVRHRSGAMRAEDFFGVGNERTPASGVFAASAATPNSRSTLRRRSGDCPRARAWPCNAPSRTSRSKLPSLRRMDAQRRGVLRTPRNDGVEIEVCTCAMARARRSLDERRLSSNEAKVPEECRFQNVTSTCAPPSNHTGTGSGLNTTPACKPTFRCGMMVRSSRRPASPVTPVSSWSLPYQPYPRCA